ncbi:MAG: sigma-70 family RNA polymerase sigma factor [Candidatus Omnitrophica bacterium]|nr:sigma-70 family RNA polymerase sigma factor [Candidatus Omnitrophota bacterium]
MPQKIKKSAFPLNLEDPNSWVDLYGDYLFRYAISRLRSKEFAENAVQETFLAALKAKSNFGGRSTPKTWLIGILKHKIVDIIRSKYKDISASAIDDDQKAVDNLFDSNGNPAQYPMDWSPNPRKIAENKEFWETFEKCLKKLPPHIADAFALREIDNLDSEKICKVLKVKPTNLWVMLHRGRLLLRACMENNWFKDNKS